MTKFARDPLYRRHRFPAEVITHAVWLYFRFPLSLRMVEDLLAARGVIVSHQTVRRWADKFGPDFANDIRKRSDCKSLSHSPPRYSIRPLSRIASNSHARMAQNRDLNAA